MINQALMLYRNAKLADNSPKKALLLLLVLFLCLWSRAQYPVYYHLADRDSAFLHTELKLQSTFSTRMAAGQYIRQLPTLLNKRGYVSASVDSFALDSLSAEAYLFIGELYSLSEILIDSADRAALELSGVSFRPLQGRKLDFVRLQSQQEQLLKYFENSGYPFAKVQLDSFYFTQNGLHGKLRIDKGPLYRIDSIRNLGNARISPDYLQRYLGIPPGSIYKKEKLETVSRRLSELPFISEQQPWDMTMLGTGSVLNLYLAPKKSSQVNVLIGLLPSNQQLQSNKMLVTGEANINLRNALGSGETIGMNWQQLQVKSPRLNLAYQHPYLFRSPFGLNFNFDLFKKDSSFVNINLQAGVQYSLDAGRTGSVFIQSQSSNLLTVDTFQVKSTRRLPQQADISSVNLGVGYEIFHTDYRLNPRKGNEWSFVATAGTRKIRKNAVIAGLTDESDPNFNFNSLYDTVSLKSYQFRIRMTGAQYFPLSRASVFKTALSAGWFSSRRIFRNELFQLGGYKLLRGFDEESIYASAYGVLTAEYRYLIARNSFLFAFTDGGWIKNELARSNSAGIFLGFGGGMAFETKAGIFNISVAAGKREDTSLNLRQSKIHLGYVNYF